MKNDDVALIQRIRNGDQNAFASLLKKYYQQIHTLVYGKTGDFQIAEDIVQETFLQVYQKLDTLEDPTLFTHWLRQIANRRCIAWIRKNKVQTETLEETDISEIEGEAYSRYVAIEQAKTRADAQRDLVEKLLMKLKERDREVIILHYFEEMTSSEIGEFLGVSENTIKSRLHRARQQLKKYELMIRESLDITTEGENYSQNQLQGETTMTNEPRDDMNSLILEAGFEAGIAIGIESALETFQKQLRRAIDDKEISIHDKNGDPLTLEALSALLDKNYESRNPFVLPESER